VWERFSTELLTNHRGKLFGALIGLIFALSVLRFGLLSALFIFMAAFVGYHIGKRIDEGADGSLSDVLERYLPPGDR